METRKYAPHETRCALGRRLISGDNVEEEVFFAIGHMKCVIRTKKYGKDVGISEITFKPVNLLSFNGHWKVEGSLVFSIVDSTDLLPKVEFCCDERDPVSEFDSSQLLHKHKILHIEFHFTTLTGMGVTPRPNYFEATDMTDICLIVGEGEEQMRLHFSKTVLAIFSDYFKAMFFGNFSENSKSEVELKDVCAQAFLNLFDLCFGAYLFQNDDEVDAGEIHELFVLADRFAMSLATERLNSFVVEHYNPSQAILCLFLADKFNLTLLMSRVMQEFTVKDVKRVQGLDLIHELRAQTLVAVLKIATG